MYQQERMDEILKILKQNHYVTVDYLVQKIRYSPASIRRDLTLLEKQGLVKRSWGGVTYKDANVSPFIFRQHSMKTAKNAIAREAAKLIGNGDVIFLDGSSTTQYMGRYLIDKKGITVITCNMILANFLGEHGIQTYCTGGKIVEHPGILGGELALETLSKFNIDVGFFSSTAFNLKGQILSVSEAGVHNHNCYRKYSKKLVYLCGSDKFETETHFVSMTLGDVDCFISDGKLPEKLREEYSKTKYIFTT